MTGQPMARARSLAQFQAEFPNEAACAAFLLGRRWPDGFVCPVCGKGRAAALKSRDDARGEFDEPQAQRVELRYAPYRTLGHRDA
jgi:hypothetical protein